MPTQIEGGTVAVGVFCFEDNDGMIQRQCKLSSPTAELTHFGGQKFRGNHPVWLSCGGASLEEKICFLNTFTHYTKNLLAKKNNQLFSWTFSM